jgi:hypothetical protein
LNESDINLRYAAYSDCEHNRVRMLTERPFFLERRRSAARVRSVHLTARASVGNRCLLRLRNWLVLRGWARRRRNSVARRFRNYHARKLTPVEAAHAHRTLLMYAGVCGRVATKATAISDDCPDKRIAITPDPFSLADQHAADDLWWVAEKFGHGFGHFGVLQNTKFVRILPSGEISSQTPPWKCESCGSETSTSRTALPSYKACNRSDRCGPAPAALATPPSARRGG